MTISLPYLLVVRPIIWWSGIFLLILLGMMELGEAMFITFLFVTTRALYWRLSTWFIFMTVPERRIVSIWFLEYIQHRGFLLSWYSHSFSENPSQATFYSYVIIDIKLTCMNIIINFYCFCYNQSEYLLRIIWISFLIL